MSDEVRLYKLVTGEEVLAQPLGKDGDGNLLLGNVGQFAILPGQGGKTQLAFQEYMPVKDGDNICLNPNAIVAIAPVSKEGEIYKLYARAFLGQQIVTPPEKTLLLPH